MMLAKFWRCIFPPLLVHKSGAEESVQYYWPSQSPTKAVSPAAPNDTVMSGSPGVLLLRRKNRFPVGRNSPIVIVPFPSQSPANGRSPAAPNGTVMSGGPDVLVFLKKKKFPEGRNTPTVIVPFPSQSPTIGISPTAP